MLESRMWTVQTVMDLPGGPLAIRRLHPKTKGIYFLIQQGEIRYIGSSVNLQDRLSQHRVKWSRETVVKWLVPEPGVDMLDIEHELIYLFRPKKNVVMNPDSDRSQSWIRGNIRSIWIKNLIARMSPESSASPAKPR